ncbi:ABC transporter permease [Pseudoalteromonas luteoviolacea S2607]|uniref:DMT family transporter n=1 Tax=Pseudoalteromonas luteoviolacea TaxID=43657 RepID=UPI0007B097C9|nr:DMT family transporter [Pseudoalteromonas luteoviolacea]KZN30728.1 ABC transporter permease [Pseudoalteromonas luteoviolacea S2607]
MNATISHAMTVQVWTMLICLSVLWGGSFFFVGVAVNSFPALTIVTLRVGIAAIVLWGIVGIFGLRPPKGLKIWVAFLVMGLLNNVIPFGLIVWGQTQITSGVASILNAATPIFTVMIAGILLPDEKPTPMKLIGVMIGFVGVAVMIGIPALIGENSLLAQLAIIGATISYACAGVYGRRFKAFDIKPLTTAAGQVTASTILLLPLTLFVDGIVDVTLISMSTWSAVIGLAVMSTAIAYVLYFKILELAGATNVLLVTLLVPVSAILLGFLFLNESLDAIHLLGMGLIAIGLCVIDGRLWNQFKARLA